MMIASVAGGTERHLAVLTSGRLRLLYAVAEFDLPGEPEDEDFDDDEEDDDDWDRLRLPLKAQWP